jgi:hypothetical protein
MPSITTSARFKLSGAAVPSYDADEVGKSIFVQACFTSALSFRGRAGIQAE